jgi:hypothetical protein
VPSMTLPIISEWVNPSLIAFGRTTMVLALRWGGRMINEREGRWGSERNGRTVFDPETTQPEVRRGPSVG